MNRVSQPRIGPVTIAANGIEEFDTGKANYLYCYDQEGLFVVHLIKQGKVVGAHMVERFTNLPDRDFDAIKVFDVSGSSNEIDLFYGLGKYDQSQDRASVVIASGTSVDIGNQPTVDIDDSTPIDMNIVSGSVSVNTVTPNKLTPKNDVAVAAAATLICAADAQSVAVRLSIKPDASNGIRLGDNGVTATKGEWMGPGMSVEIELDNTAIYGFRDGASNVDVTVTLLERV